MKHKKVIFFLLLVLILLIIYITLYNKTYSITVNSDNVYEIEIQTLATFGLKEKTITDVNQIEAFLDEARNIKFTHPKINMGKGWVTAVDIKIKDKEGNENLYRYTILYDKISIGSFQYEIISK